MQAAPHHWLVVKQTNRSHQSSLTNVRSVRGLIRDQNKRVFFEFCVLSVSATLLLYYKREECFSKSLLAYCSITAFLSFYINTACIWMHLKQQWKPKKQHTDWLRGVGSSYTRHQYARSFTVHLGRWPERTLWITACITQIMGLLPRKKQRCQASRGGHISYICKNALVRRLRTVGPGSR